jgi:competence ComEA-like helix-hairpin-helix protein
MNRLIVPLILLSLAMPAAAGEWTELQIRLLPDSSFALIETDGHGRRHRHCPFRDRDGDIDVDQLIRVLGRLDRETWIDPANAAVARKVLDRHYRRCYARLAENGLPDALDLNSASPGELIRLPGIGPVLAVRIIEYRDHRGTFLIPEDIMKVEGISRATFLSVRHYIETH